LDERRDNSLWRTPGEGIKFIRNPDGDRSIMHNPTPDAPSAIDTPPSGGMGRRRWYICGLLLAATTINYMDRQTLSVAAKRIQEELKLSNEQYGDIELGFGLAFAAGGLIFGFAADWLGVRYLYPALLLAWSAVGFLTGRVNSYEELLVCRIALGLFEAGHWPCALKTTQRILSRRERGLGNSILQSGSSVGAIATPLVMQAMLTPDVGSWRGPFQVIGAAGALWVVFWMMWMTADDHARAPADEEPADAKGGKSSEADTATDEGYWAAVLSRRFLVLVIIVLAINICWHMFRVWLPKFLQDPGGRQYSETFANYFTSAYYVATDVGVIIAGFLMHRLPKYGFTVHGARTAVFLGCGVLTALTAVAAFLPAGPVFLLLLLLVGAGSLGLFPCYYSFTQELSVKNQGKVAGTLSMIAWMTSFLHPLYGRYIDETKNYDLGIALSGLPPIIAGAVLLFCWKRSIAPRAGELKHSG